VTSPTLYNKEGDCWSIFFEFGVIYLIFEFGVIYLILGAKYLNFVLPILQDGVFSKGMGSGG